jgi:chitinase
MPNKTLVWAFATGTCDAESWAGITPAMEATNVQAFVNAGKNYIISTGGANGTFDCSSGQGLINFINRYNSANLVGVDFDMDKIDYAAGRKITCPYPFRTKRAKMVIL